MLVRRHVTLERLRSNNDVAGFKFATVGVLYSVLVGFAVLVVWQKFNDAQRYVAEEASAAATVYRLSKGIETETGAGVRDAMSGYLKAAIAKDWPAMATGQDSSDVDRALDELFAATLRFHPADRRDGTMLSELLNQLALVSQARRSARYQ